MPESKSQQSKETASTPLVNSRRLNVTGWSQANDRVTCLWAYYEAPDRTPHVYRHQVAGARLHVVDRTSKAMLLCNGLHEGDCQWPGGEGIGEIDDVRHARIMAEIDAMGGGSPQSSTFPAVEAPLTDPVPPRRR